MKWDSTHGIWSLVSNDRVIVRGTTFRNAGYLTIELGTPNYSAEVFFGRHIGVTLWLRNDCKLYEWKPKKCRCYGCAIHRPMSPEVAKAISEVMRTIKGKKLPPRKSQ